MKFRIKGTEEILVFKATIDGDLVLCPENKETPHYIDTYFEGDDVPELEVSVDGIMWWIENQDAGTEK